MSGSSGIGDQLAASYRANATTNRPNTSRISVAFADRVAESNSSGESVRIPFAIAIVSTLFGPLSPSSRAQTTPEFHFQFTEKPGAYSVGFKVVEQYDRSRKFLATPNAPATTDKSENPRPLQTLIWYPANPSTGPTMTLGDYAALIKTETTFNKPLDQGKPQLFVDSFFHGTTDGHAWAVRDAEKQAGHFPVVIYAPSVNAPATENIELCEYLVSWGLLVIASPSMGASSRQMTIDLDGANAEAQDISFLLDFATTLPNADISAAAVAGYSWGGMAALLAAARDKRVDALISLDSSFVMAGDIHPDQMTIPFLAFSRGEDPLEFSDSPRKDKTQSDSGPNVLNEWTHGDLIHVRMLAMSHIQFSSLYQRSERFRKEAPHFSPDDYSLGEGAQSYGWIAVYTRQFLRAYLKHDPDAQAFLSRSAIDNGAPRHLFFVNVRKASPKPQ
jgi:dienelactone hydrolase